MHTLNDAPPPYHDPRATRRPYSHNSSDARNAKIAALILPVLALILYLPLQIAGTAVSHNHALAEPLPIVTIPIAYEGADASDPWYQTWIVSVYLNGCCARPLTDTPDVTKSGKSLYPVHCFYNGAGKTFGLKDVMASMINMDLGPGKTQSLYGYDGTGFEGVKLNTAPGFAFLVIGMVGVAAVLASRVVWPKAWKPKAQRAPAPKSAVGFAMHFLRGVAVIEWAAWAAWLCSVFAAAWLTGCARKVVSQTYGTPFVEDLNEYNYAKYGMKGSKLTGGWAAMMWIAVILQGMGALCLWFYFWVEQRVEAYNQHERGPVELTSASQAAIDEAFARNMKAGASPGYAGSRDEETHDA